MIGGLGSRLSPPARRFVVAGLVLVALGAGVVALAPKRKLAQGTHRPSSQTPAIGKTPRGRERPPAIPAQQLARARGVARAFLAGYLPFVYGRGSSVSVPAVTAALRRQLRRDRALVTPIERARHPRVVSLTASAEAPGVVVATALIDDGGITVYSLRITLREGRVGLLVSAVDQG
jgi:hypothetical protein